LILVLLVLPWSAMAAGSDLVTLQATDTPVGDVLKILADRGGLNIVTSPEVSTRMISIRLSETPFEEALNLVVRAAGLAYERVGGTILVADVDRLLTRTGLVTRVFDLQFADPERVREALEVVTESIAVEPQQHRIVVHATHSELEQIAEVIRELDRRPRQVLLEARLVEINTSSLMQVGIDWEKLTKWSTKIVEGYAGPSQHGEVPDEIDYVRLTDGAGFFRQYATFDLAIDALITDGHARLLSNVKIATLDGSPAEIFAGETVPVVITSLQSPGSAGGTMQSIQLEKIDVGVKLNITPRVTEDGFITALVEPEVSRILKYVGPDEDLPQTSTRRAEATVRVRDGETIYLGGLLSEETHGTYKKVPLLGNLPLLGALFRYSKDETNRYDLVIEITPRIIGDSGADLPRSALENPHLAPTLLEVEAIENGIVPAADTP
jgi:type II secretory pathway component GspD/PulD (secretin)